LGAIDGEGCLRGLILDLVVITGTSVRDVVLAAASLLRQEFVPGLVSLALLIVLVFCTFRFALRMRNRVAALNRIAKEITRHRDAAELSARITDIDRNIKGLGASGAKGRVAAAWREFRETLVPHEEAGQVILRNSVRPSAFFNVEDLGFSPGFWRYVPSLFVSVGLFLTFLGLVSALESIVPPKGEVIGNDQLSTLLSVASAKFIMSLTGLLCSILFTVVLRMGTAQVEAASHHVANQIEERQGTGLIFASIRTQPTLMRLHNLKRQHDVPQRRPPRQHNRILEGHSDDRDGAIDRAPGDGHAAR